MSVVDDGWPGGSFGLPKPKSGCPGDETDGWYEGWRFQDMEDDRKSLDRRTRTSPGSHMSATISEDKKDIRRKFCMKQNTRVQKYWPKGNFV